MPTVSTALAVLASLVSLAAPSVDIPNDASGSGSLFGTRISANVRYGTPPDDVAPCHWHHVVDTDSLTGVYGPISRTMGDTAYSLFERNCDGPPHTSRQFWVRDDAHSSLAVRASDKVTAHLPRPMFGLAPAAKKMVVNVGTWFWITPAVWRPVSVTAYLVTPEGVVWVRTTASPVRSLYRSGDASGRTVSCNGPGKPWVPSLGDRAVSTCMYTYTHSSTGTIRTNYRAAVGIEWKVSWTSNLGMQGVLPNVRTFLPVAVRVREIQALTTS